MKNEKTFTINKSISVIYNHPIKTMLIILVLFLSLYILNLNNVNIELKLDKNNLSDSLFEKKIIIDSLTIDLDSIKSENDSIKKEMDDFKDINRFMKDIALRESGGNHKIVSQHGMMGLYQFDPRTLDFLGINQDDYLSSVDVQNKAMISYLKYNKSVLNKYISKYDGKEYQGIHITSSGILAGAHLTGPGGVMEFFDKENKYNEYDGNNIHVSEYIKAFAGYKILTYL